MLNGHQAKGMAEFAVRLGQPMLLHSLKTRYWIWGLPLCSGYLLDQQAPNHTFNHQLIFGSVMTGATVAAYTITATGWTADAAWGTPVKLPVPVLYPQTATTTLLPLSAANNWAPEASHLLAPFAHRPTSITSWLQLLY